MTSPTVDVVVEIPKGSRNKYEVYKLIEPDKHSSTRGWGGAHDAWTEIEASRARYT